MRLGHRQPRFNSLAQSFRPDPDRLLKFRSGYIMALRRIALSCALLSLLLGAAAVSAGTPAKDPADLHIKFTSLRPRTPQCLKRGQELIETLRNSLEKYQDSKAAQAAGYSGYYTEIG